MKGERCRYSWELDINRSEIAGFIYKDFDDETATISSKGDCVLQLKIKWSFLCSNICENIALIKSIYHESGGNDY